LNLDTALITVASAGLWLVGCCAFVSAAQEWVQDRSEKSARERRLSQLCD
jgi:hypothetical protein